MPANLGCAGSVWRLAINQYFNAAILRSACRTVVIGYRFGICVAKDTDTFTGYVVVGKKEVGDGSGSGSGQIPIGVKALTERNGDIVGMAGDLNLPASAGDGVSDVAQGWQEALLKLCKA